jgi:hypothetical protein
MSFDTKVDIINITPNNVKVLYIFFKFNFLINLNAVQIMILYRYHPITVFKSSWLMVALRQSPCITVKTAF